MNDYNEEDVLSKGATKYLDRQANVDYNNKIDEFCDLYLQAEKGNSDPSEFRSRAFIVAEFPNFVTGNGGCFLHWQKENNTWTEMNATQTKDKIERAFRRANKSKLPPENIDALQQAIALGGTLLRMRL